jgi:hypothetical protein
MGAVTRLPLALAAAMGVVLVAVGTVTAVAAADRAYPAYPAVLAGHAVLPALTLLVPPPAAPVELRISGKYAKPPATGEFTWPFAGQPVQGHSAIRRADDGSFWLLTDNGAGSKSNSPDFMLQLNRYRVDFDSGKFTRLQTLFLRDPLKKAPFPIVTDGTADRYLTGSDFDPESLHFAGGQMWIGDEFGPYLLKFDPDGRLLAVIDTLVDGRAAQSPDHPGGLGSIGVARSKGLEAMAGSPDGRLLYPMLEGPLAGEPDPRAVRILEFDVAAERWTGRHWNYPLEQDGNAIGDFTMIDATTALVIERDGRYGTADKACLPGEPRNDCFTEPAQFKRVYKIEMGEERVGGPVRKVGFTDLMSITDPRGLARVPLTHGVLTFPFATIESLDVVDGRHIVIGNDNNLPYSSSREPGRIDDNELVLLDVAALLGAA